MDNQQPSVNNDPMIEPDKLFVGGLSWETTKESLTQYFSQYGEVVECVVMMEKDLPNPRPRGFGFVTFANVQSVASALAIKEHFLDGKKIDPRQATKKGSGGIYKIFLGGVSPDTKEEDITQVFSDPKFGLKEVHLKRNQDNAKSRGFGFLTVESEECLKNVLSRHFYIIKDKNVEVKKADSRNATPKVPPVQQSAHSNSFYPNTYNPYGPAPPYQTSQHQYMTYPANSYGSNYSGYSPQPTQMYPTYGGRGYSGQQHYPSQPDSSYSQAPPSNYNASPYSNAMIDYSNFKQPAYNYGEQSGGGGSPSYNRAGLGNQPRDATGGNYTYATYGGR